MLRGRFFPLRSRPTRNPIMNFSRTLRLCVLAITFVLASRGTATPPPISLKPISSGQIVSPVNICNAGDGSNRLFVCDQAGWIHVIRDEMVLPVKFLDISAKLVPKSTANPGNYPFPLSTSYDERGLLGMAFHPNYNKLDAFNQPLPGFGRFYVFYSAPSPNPRGTSTIGSISVASPCTITTTAVHRLITGDVVTMSGVTGGNFSQSINGTFTVTMTSATTFTVPVSRIDNTTVTLNSASRVFPNQPVNCRTTISEFQVSASNPNVADPLSERVLLAFDKPQSNHNGGQLEFGPDGYLYISIGDGGSQHDNDFGHAGGTSPGSTASPTGNLGNAQDRRVPYGKILRINPLQTVPPALPAPYSIPADNPFVGQSQSIAGHPEYDGPMLGEIYSFGMRNPWRFSFDVGPGGTNRLFEGDVGQDKVEEVNIIVSGGNYGWRLKEGTFDHDNTAPSGGSALIDPIAQYAHSGVTIGSPALLQVGASVTGGYLYRGSQIPALVGMYVFGDYSQSIASATGTLLALEQVPANSNNWVLSLPTVVGGNPLATRVYAFGRDEQGELYVATKVSQGPFQLDANGKPTGAISKIVAAQVSTALLYPSKDNTIYSDFPTNSNALGSLYSGNNANGNPRRALLAFDIAGNLPAGALVTSASLTLHLSSSANGTNPSSMSLCRLSQDWGEGTSNGIGSGAAATTGDATWTARLYDATNPTLWTPAAGGTYSAAASATATVGPATGYYSWASVQLAADVQGWQNAPSANFGWILLGDEVATSTARVFDSREAAAAQRPVLQIGYNPVAPPLTRRESWLRQYFPTPGTYVDDLADLNGDGTPTLVEYAFALSPIAANPSGSGFLTSVASTGGTVTYTMTFRRDPRATDLTYQIQTTGDLITWGTVAQSVAGAVPTGTASVSEVDAPGESPIKIVTVIETLPAPANRFSRLKVTRAY